MCLSYLEKAGDIVANDSVGQIGLDLVVNKNDFDRQMLSIQGIAKKAAKALASAFAIKKLVNFGTQCVELGSDLAEVQNVVDTTFPRMSKQVDEFAKNAATSFGLSETMAKKFTGTYGAMAKAFGFNEKAAYEMSTALTGLAGDVASFYNISQDEAYTKLKSVFSGETETLKDLGIVMTQTALDSYALANGFGKTTKSMSEMEKVALRYSFVQSQLSSAAGDFTRTADGWANQVRVLKLQFDSLKATIGQGLINALTPVIKVINTIIGKLMSLANAFKAFTDMLAGKKSGGGASAAGMEAVAAAADNASNAVAGTGSAAKKAAKDIKGATTGIDELNIINQPDEADSGGSGASGGGGYAADEFSMGELNPDAMQETENRFQGIIDKVNELAGCFSSGFWDAFGDTSAFDRIKEHIGGIRESLSGIFTDPEVAGGANRFAETVAYAFGQISGSVTSIGVTIAENFVGGIDRYLSQNSQRIKGYLVSMFDIGSEISEISGNFSAAVADIFTVFQSDSAKQITADLIGIFSDAFMGATTLVSSFGLNVLDLIASPIINNSDKIKSALSGIVDAIGVVVSGISSTFGKLVDGLIDLYDKHIDPLFRSLRDGFSEIAGVVLDAFNAYILPVIKDAASQFSQFCTDALQPLIEKFLEFAGKVIDCIRAVWESVLRPFIVWFVENVAPLIAENLQRVVNVFFSFLNSVADVIGSVLKTLDGLLEFIIGVFTGNWKQAWEGIKQFFSGIWDTMKALVNACVSAIYAIIETVLNAIKSVWELIWNGVSTFFGQIWNSIQTTVANALAAVKDGISGALTSIRTTWTDTWENLRKTTSEIFDKMWSGIKGVINSILSGVETMANGVVRGINKMIDALNSISFDIPDWVPELGGKSFGFDIPSIPEVKLPRLAQGGFVRANTPQLAMIGDNRHYGEVVAPEDKMQEMVNQAVAMASQGGMSDQYLLVVIDLLKDIISLIEAMDLTVKIDIRDIKKKLVELDRRSGVVMRTT